MERPNPIRNSTRWRRLAVYIGLPIGIISASAMLAHATIDTSWITAGNTISATNLQNDLVGLQSQITALQNQLDAGTEYVAAYQSDGYETFATTSVAATTWTAVPYTLALADTTNGAVSTTSGWVFTPPVSGLYRVMASVQITTATTGTVEFAFYQTSVSPGNLSPTNGIILSAQRTSPGANDSINLDGIAYLSTGEGVTFGVYSENATSIAASGVPDRSFVHMDGPFPNR